MAAGAVAVLEGDVRAGVDGDAVILVVDLGTGDGNAGGAANIESIGVVAAPYRIQLASHVVYQYEECDLEGGGFGLPASPSALSMVIPVIVRSSQPLMLTAWTGVFLM